MRGKDAVKRHSARGFGITPAYAGKSAALAVGAIRLGDHPRVCGEKPTGNNAAAAGAGSPPRMRGKAFTYPCIALCYRITPAYAGKSLLMLWLCPPPWDHPRVCGEKSIVRKASFDPQGSPPRMRGKDNQVCPVCSKSGITPAYAGKRLKRSRSTVSPVAIVPLFPSVCNKPVVSDGSPAVRDAPLFLPAENAVPASPACNLRSL